MSTLRRTFSRQGRAQSGIVAVVVIDGALHDVIVCRDASVYDATTRTDITAFIGMADPVWFTRRRADSARINLGLLAYAGRSAKRLGLVVGQTFPEFVRDSRWDNVRDRESIVAAWFGQAA